jgi:Asp-tRNA(Asn)/Glu-tRNA(Gln) amidotransferase A subunit family amidase
MMAALDRAARIASAAGAKVQDLHLPDALTAAFQAHSTIQAYEAAQSLAPEYDLAAATPGMIGKGIRDLIEQGMGISVESYDEARRIARHARRALADMISGVDVLLSPAAPGAAPIGLTTTGSSTFNRLWTLMGTPCVSVPGLADAGGLPLGMQIIGRFGDDRRTLEAARFVESAIARTDR